VVESLEDYNISVSKKISWITGQVLQFQGFSINFSPPWS
jgi:hypothetical protein